MRRFVFRAEAALELRRRQEEEALRVLGAAEARERVAARMLADAEQQLSEALSHAREAECVAGDTTLRMWHRNWIVGRQQRVGRCRTEVEARRSEVNDARRLAMDARRKRKTLERLKQKAFVSWQEAERREEQKAIDDLATVRFVQARTGGHP